MAWFVPGGEGIRNPVEDVVLVAGPRHANLLACADQHAVVALDEALFHSALHDTLRARLLQTYC